MATDQESSANSPTSRNKPNFDATSHQLPRYTLSGQMLPIKIVPGKPIQNILTDKVRLPEWWTGQTPGAPRTKTLIDLENRRKNIPDPSYDLDGDGVVSCREYFLAKRFDQDGDGKLNTAERRNAIAALQSGYEDLFRWNVEAAGAHRGKRLIQVRGKVVEAEDFGPVQETYPAHPLSKYKPHVSSLPELRAKRKAELMENLKKQREHWEKNHPINMPVQFVQSEFLVDKPKHLSMAEIKEEIRRKAREKNGLSPTPSGPKDTIKVPSMDYVEDAKIKTRSEFLLNLRQTNIKDLSKFGDNNHADAVERLKIRDDAMNRLNNTLAQGLTYKEIEEKRRKEAMDHNMRTFAHTIVGVHGQELPKFSETAHLREYWKNRSEFYKPEPKQKSQLEYKQTVKYWAKPDAIRLADVKETQPPLDPLKAFEKLTEKKADVPQKVNEVSPRPPVAEKPFHTVVSKKSPSDSAFHKYKSVYDEDPTARPSYVKKEEEPLYSSFSPDKIFKDPYPYYGTVNQYFIK